MLYLKVLVRHVQRLYRQNVIVVKKVLSIPGVVINFGLAILNAVNHYYAKSTTVIKYVTLETVLHATEKALKNVNAVYRKESNLA